MLSFAATINQRRTGYAIAALGSIIPTVIIIGRYLFLMKKCYAYYNPILHTFIESCNCMLSLSLGFLLFDLQMRIHWSTKFLWSSCAIISMGILTGFHALWASAPNELAATETICNLVGGIFASCCWLPKSLWSKKSERIWVLLCTLIFALAVCAVISRWFHLFPVFTIGWRFTRVEVVCSVLAGVLLAAGAVRCFRDFKTSKNVKDLYLGDYYLLSATSTVIPANAFYVWGITWWSWHVVQFVAILSVLILFAHLGSSFAKELSNNEEKFRILSSELELSNESLRQFTAFASHDLRAPMLTIESYLSLLKAEYGTRLPPEAHDFIDRAIRGSKRMENLVDGFLDLAEQQSAKRDFTNVSLDEVLSDTLQNLRTKIETCEAKVVVEPLPAVNGNKDQLIDLFQNLIGNAIKFRSPERSAQVIISGARGEKGIEVNVKDNGLGIDPKFHSVIFEPLKRLHGSEIDGHGLGLSICKVIADRHGATLLVSSVPKQGSLFTVTFPTA